MVLKIALLTSCSVSRNFDPLIKIEHAPIKATMNDLLDWWTTIMAAEEDTQPDALKTPGELYAGVSFDIVTEIAQDIGHDNIYIVTGGVGLVKHTAKIVPYDFTSDKNATHNARTRVIGEKFIPHVWWSKINEALHGEANPIAQMMSHYDIVVGALPKNFIKYIVHDLQNISQEDLQTKVFIPIPRSMIGSVPKIVRDAFVPYGGLYTSDIGFNRYDKAQRVAQKFIRNCTTANSAIEHANDTMQESQEAALINGNMEVVDYDVMFKEHSSLLDLPDVGSAIHNAKVLGIKIGGKHRFAGAWRGARGLLVIKPTKKALTEAKSSLGTMLAGARLKSYRDDEKLLGQLGLFVQAVREEKPDLIFTAKDVAAWGKIMYDETEDITSTTKISYVLNYHIKYLGLKKPTMGTVSGFRIVGGDT